MPSSEKSKCCGAYVTRRFFMPCYSCACLMGNSELLCMWSGWIVPLYREKSERRRESKHCGLYGLHFANNCTHYGAWAAHLNKKVTLEEILVLRRVWITLRQQLHECLSPDKGRVVGQLL